MKNAIFAILNFAFFIIFFSISMPIWILFLFLSVFYLFRSIQEMYKKETPVSSGEPAAFEYGLLGYWDVDGDKSFGAYIDLMNTPVFVDIREDKFFEERKVFAEKLIKNREILEDNLKEFIKNNPAYSDFKLNSIGLHSKSLDQGEVFWDPDGYTILKGFDFCGP